MITIISLNSVLSSSVGSPGSRNRRIQSLHSSFKNFSGVGRNTSENSIWGARRRLKGPSTGFAWKTLFWGPSGNDHWHQAGRSLWAPLPESPVTSNEVQLAINKNKQWLSIVGEATDAQVEVYTQCLRHLLWPVGPCSVPAAFRTPF